MGVAVRGGRDSRWVWLWEVGGTVDGCGCERWEGQ